MPCVKIVVMNIVLLVLLLVITVLLVNVLTTDIKKMVLDHVSVFKVSMNT
jgi:hypothetical protein